MPNLSILDTSIRQLDGLYSLNDLHRASGGIDKHAPNRFSRLIQTKDLITEIRSTPDMALPLKSIRGKGIYACKELVYAYAMWISPKFNLLVIRAFDAMQQAQQPEPKVSQFTVSGIEYMTLQERHAQLQIRNSELQNELLALYRDKVTQLETPTTKRHKSRPLTEADKAEIHDLLAQGLSQNEVARQVQRSSATVHFIKTGGAL